jgi:uncharacterized damage-inducible protein DinB
MHTPDQYMTMQYQMVKEARNVLLEYCDKISQEDLVSTRPEFARGGSIRNLLIHNVNVYEVWIGQQFFKKTNITKYSDVNDIAAIRQAFEAVDSLMEAFISAVNNKPGTKVSYQVNNINHDTTALRFFTHVITHEFHHKGQILTLSRHLGYHPVDTDIIR